VIHYEDDQITLHHGDALEVLRTLPNESVNCVVTSPPYYGLRNYGEPGQYGLEPTPAAYIETMRAVFAEVRRVLAADGTLWLNLGDTYASKANAGASVGMTRRADRAEVIPARHNTTAEAPYKSLLMIPERVAWALIEDGWTLRSRIVWVKPNPLPETVKDRPSSHHETLFMLTTSSRYWFDLDAIRVPHAERYAERVDRYGSRDRAALPERVYAPGDRKDSAAARGILGLNRTGGLNPLGRNPGDVWEFATQPFPGAHFAVMPPALAKRCILAGCRPGGVVLDPFAGSGTTGMVALKHGRRFVGIDLSAKYLDLALRTRLAQSALMEGA
jgi:DNA modification methylase